MNLPRFVSLSALLLVTAMGCCHNQCVVYSDPCDPCGSSMSGCGCGCGGGCGLGNWWHRQVAKWRMAHCCCHNYNWCSDCSGACGAPSCGGMSAPMYSSPSPGCGCSQGAAIPNVPPTYAPSPTPAGVNSTTAPNSAAPPPMPAGADPMTYQPPASGKIQHVSYEEFQRLPGVIISNPTSESSVPSIEQPTLPPPPLPPGGIQQAQWIPVK